MNPRHRHRFWKDSQFFSSNPGCDSRNRFGVGGLIFAGLTGLGIFAALPAMTQTAPTVPATPGETQPSPGSTGTETGPAPSPSPQPSPGLDRTAPGSPTPLGPSPQTPSPSPRPPIGPTPAPTPQATPSPTPRSTRNVPLSQLLQQGASVGPFQTLSRAIQTAGLTNTLETQGGRYTIFAPTDAAFAALPAGTVEQLLQPANRAVLARLLAYHVVPQELRSNQIRTGSLSTLGGGIAVRVDGGRVIVNNGSVIQADIEAANGVIHAINRVLIPPQLLQELNQ